MRPARGAPGHPDPVGKAPRAAGHGLGTIAVLRAPDGSGRPRAMGTSPWFSATRARRFTRAVVARPIHERAACKAGGPLGCGIGPVTPRVTAPSASRPAESLANGGLLGFRLAVHESVGPDCPAYAPPKALRR